MHFQLVSLGAVVLLATAQSFDEVTEVTGCHAHTDVQYCIVGDTELPVVSDIDIDTAPDSYSGCHAHGDEL